jgi:alanine racemase
MTDFVKRPTFAEIDLSRLRSNFRSSRDFIGHHLKYMAVVKANAYGHGAVECSKVLVEEGVDWLGVAIIEEAVELRDADLDVPILCLGGFFPGQEQTLLKREITPVIFNIEQATSLAAIAAANGLKANVHVKVDTGMGRLGIRWDDLDDFIQALRQNKNLKVQGVMSHFACANDPQEEDFTNRQIDRFHEVVARFEAAGFAPELTDIANSPGAVGHPRSRGQMVRLGGILYGLGRDVLDQQAPKPELCSVMSLYSEVADLKTIRKGETLGYGRSFTTQRDSKIALVPIGYNDGYRRQFSNQASALVRGTVARVTGRVSMDWTIIDVTDVPDVSIGDRVTLVGTDGGQTIAAEELARYAETISYEITCGISSRVPRKYVE